MLKRTKVLIINDCNDCPHFDNEYWTFNMECELLKRILKISDRSGCIDIPDDCPLVDFNAKKN